MAVLVPDIIICNTLNDALDVVRQDYIDRVSLNQEDRSLLYLLFHGQTIGTYDLYDNAKKLLITTEQDPNHLDVKLSYDHNKTDQKSMIFVTLAAESDRNNSLSIGEADQDELSWSNPDTQDEYRKLFMRRYSTTYQVVIMSQNKNEGAVLYNFFKELLVTCITHLEIEGLSNMKIGGQDIRMNNAVVDRLFQRAITVNFEYQQVVPELVLRQVFTKLRLSWKPQGADQPSGSIDINASDSF